MLIAVVILLLSIFWVELVRDFYHWLAHQWQPLYRLHGWHHRVFRPDLSVVSDTIYKEAHWYNDVPEALVMLSFGVLFWFTIAQFNLAYSWTAWAGSIYTLTFLVGAIARGAGVPNADELTDITHRPGDFTTIPGNLFVNKPYHWRHHFDNQNAYFCGTLTFLDKVLGTALSLKGKKIAVTGASGTLGLALLKYLHLSGAKITALTSSNREITITNKDENIPVKTLSWEVGNEAQLAQELEKIDILIINHGLNVHGEKTQEAIEKSYQINTFSSYRLMELFLSTVKTNQDIVRKELWINTSEAEVNPAFSPLYELSKRTLGDLITLKRLNSPCVIRKLILGPFKSNLNPIGIMSADWVAKQIVNSAKRDFRNIIVTINPLTYLLFPVKEFFVSHYFKLFTNK
jgi:monoglucosyldiacylglycerol epimerase